MALNVDPKEFFSGLWRRIKANIDRAAFIVFFLLLIIMAGIYGYEITRPEPPMQEFSAKPINPELPNENYQIAMDYLQGEPQLGPQDELRPIQEFNIFDYKTVSEREELERAANRKFERAASLYEQGNLDETERLLQEILLTWPSHQQSRELMNKIEQARATPTPTPTPTRRAPLPGFPEEQGVPGAPGGERPLF